MADEHDRPDATSELSLEDLQGLTDPPPPFAGANTIPPEAEEILEVLDSDVVSIPAPRPRSAAAPARKPSSVPPPLRASRPPQSDRPPAPPSTSAAPPPDLTTAADDLVRASIAELETAPPSTRAFRLHFEVAHHCESVLNRPEVALEHYRAALLIQPDHVPSLRGTRRIASRKKNWDDALAALDAEARATRDTRQRAGLYYLRGRILADDVGDSARARAALQAALELDRSNVVVLSALERLATLDGNWAEVERLLDLHGSAVTADPALKATLVAERAMLRENRLGDAAGAIDLFETALLADPASEVALVALKRLLTTKRRSRDLVRVLEHAAERESDAREKATTLAWAGRVYADQLGEREMAIESLLRALELAPDSTLTADALAQLFEETGQFDSLSDVLAARAEQTTDASLLRALREKLGAVAQEKLGDDSAAIDWFERARELEPRFGPTLERLKQLLASTGRFPELLQVLRTEVELLDDPRKKAAICVRMGDLSENELGRPDEAIEHYLRALSAVPDYAPALGSLDRLLADTQRWRELADLHRRAVEQSATPSAQIAHLLRIAQIYDDELFEPESALEVYREVLALDGENLTAVRGLGRAGERARSYADVVDSLERESSLSPVIEAKAYLLIRAGDVAATRMGDTERAQHLYRRALVAAPENRAALEGLVAVLLKLGRWEALLEVHHEELKLITSDSDRSRLLLRMGEIAETRAGNHGEATRLYREALAADSRNLAARRALVRRLKLDGEWAAVAEQLSNEIASPTAAESERGAAALDLARVLEDRLAQPGQALETLLAGAPLAVADRDTAADVARLLREAGQSRELSAHLEATANARVGPKKFAALVELADVADVGLSDTDAAIRALERAAEEEPSSTLVVRRLAALHERAQNWNAVALNFATLARVLREPNERAAALWDLARVDRRRLQETADARDAYQAILSLVEGDPAALDALERIALDQGDRRLLVEVDTLLARQAEDAPLRAVYLTRLGESYEALGDARATASYQAALDAEPESLTAIRGLARLADALGDPELLADAITREAQFTHDRKTAAALLMRSASVRGDKLGDDDGAARDLERALELDPSHTDAARALTRRLLERGEPARAAEVLARAAGAAAEGEARAEMWLEVARIQSDLLGNAQQAIASLGRVLKAHPNHVTAIRQLAALYARDGQWMDAVNLMTRVRELTRDPIVLRDSNLELSRIWLEKLSDPDRALDALEAVLALDPYNRTAIARQSEAHESARRWEQASEAAERLLELSPQGADRIDVLLRIARLEERQGNRDRARSIRLDCVREDGPGGEAALLLKSELSGPAEWTEYARAMERHIELCLSRGHTPIPAVLDLSRVCHAELGDAQRAAAVLEHGISFSGASGALRMELAERLRDAGRVDDALAELSRVVEEDSTVARPFHEITKLRLARGDREGARHAAEVVAVLGDLTVDEKAFLEASPRRPRLGHGSALQLETTLAWLPREGTPGAVTRLLRELSPFLGKVYPPDHDAFGLTARDREATRQPSPLRSLADAITKATGSRPLDLYVHRVRSRGVALELGETPSLFVPAALNEMTETQQAFLIAKPILAVVAGVDALEKLTPRELEVLVAAAVRLVKPGFGEGLTSEEVLEDTKKRVAKAMSRKSRRTVEELAAFIADGPPVDYAAWAEQAHQALRELSALLADDLVDAVELTRRLDRELSQRESDDLIRRSPALQSLLRLWISDKALAVRAQLLPHGSQQHGSPPKVP
jgi:tetratricopeptide (TPR) repeat protein